VTTGESADGTPTSPFDVSGRVVIVTGASSGIGEWVARRLDREGALVVMAARRRERLDALAAELSSAVAVPCDVAEDGDRAHLVERALEAFGRIDGLVNNAGILKLVPATRESTEDFRHILEVDLVAPFDLAKRCLPSFRERGGGSIVNITSMSAIVATGLQMPSAGYCAAKAGLAHLTRELAVQWGRYNVRVNAVAPGIFGTEMTPGVTQTSEVPDFFLDRLALRRLGGEGDIEGTILFLLSDASTYVTGQQIAVDGGRTIS
jgi:NAD(P)-dependent dehydrogenase (short-subunit alcohol dehydrogenase family)